MYPVKYMATLTAAACLLLLAACGGGGGVTTEPPFGDTVPADATELLDGVGPSLYRLVPTTEVSAGGSSLAAGPDVANVNSSFDGEHFVVTLDRRGADDIRLDSADAIRDPFEIRSVVGLPDRSGLLGYTFDSTSNSATFGDVFVDWSSTDPADYVAGGFWMHADTSSADWEFGAFVDGPELRLSNPPILPTSGTASYEGESHILGILVEDGEEARRFRFRGTNRLTADFSGGTIEGCLVCDDPVFDISVGRVAFDRSNGSFQGSNLTVTSPNQTFDFTQSGGQWTGRFSNIPDSSGAPRLAAGAFAGTALRSDGATHTYLGAFGAGRSQ